VNPFEFSFRGSPGPDTLNSVRASLLALMNMVQAADVAPTTQLVAAASDRQKAAAQIMNRWAALKTQELTALNAQLKNANLPAINIEPSASPERP
jgi:hypothetical protein